MLAGLSFNWEKAPIFDSALSLSYVLSSLHRSMRARYYAIVQKNAKARETNAGRLCIC